MPAPRTPATCPVCGDLVRHGGVGRPATYCGVECRREHARRLRVVADLEAELAAARDSLRDEAWRPGRAHYWSVTVAMVEAQLVEARADLPLAGRALHEVTR